MSAAKQQQPEAYNTFVAKGEYLMFTGSAPLVVVKPSIWDGIATEDEIFGDYYQLDGSIQNMLDYLKSVLPDIRFLNSHNPCVDELTIYTNYNFKLETCAKYEGYDCIVPTLDPNFDQSVPGIPIFRLTPFNKTVGETTVFHKNNFYSGNVIIGIYIASKGVAMYYGQNEQIDLLNDFNIKKGTWPCVYMKHLYNDNKRNEYFTVLDKKFQDLIEQNEILTKLKVKHERRMELHGRGLNPYLEED